MNYPTDLSAEEQLRARARLADLAAANGHTGYPPGGPTTGSSPHAPCPPSLPPGSIRQHPAR
ncbi:MAG TPA: hypothetical protein VJT72_01280 [Pseudonocardiaceae bacterium]|nr:hypothetical protein [Pseudonocardiaceae bacterium]